MRLALVALALAAAGCASTGVPSRQLVGGRLVNCVGDQEDAFHWVEKCEDGTVLTAGFDGRR